MNSIEKLNAALVDPSILKGKVIDARTSRVSPEVYQALAQGKTVEVTLQQLSPQRANLVTPLIAAVAQLFGSGGAAYNESLSQAVAGRDAQGKANEGGLAKAAEFVGKYGQGYSLSPTGGGEHIDVVAQFKVLENEGRHIAKNVDVPIKINKPEAEKDEIKDPTPGDDPTKPSKINPLTSPLLKAFAPKAPPTPSAIKAPTITVPNFTPVPVSNGDEPFKENLQMSQYNSTVKGSKGESQDQMAKRMLTELYSPLMMKIKEAKIDPKLVNQALYEKGDFKPERLDELNKLLSNSKEGNESLKTSDPKMYNLYRDLLDNKALKGTGSVETTTNISNLVVSQAKFKEGLGELKPVKKGEENVESSTTIKGASPNSDKKKKEGEFKPFKDGVFPEKATTDYLDLAVQSGVKIKDPNSGKILDLPALLEKAKGIEKTTERKQALGDLFQKVESGLGESYNLAETGNIGAAHISAMQRSLIDRGQSLNAVVIAVNNVMETNKKADPNAKVDRKVLNEFLKTQFQDKDGGLTDKDISAMDEILKSLGIDLDDVAKGNYKGLNEKLGQVEKQITDLRETIEKTKYTGHPQLGELVKELKAIVPPAKEEETQEQPKDQQKGMSGEKDNNKDSTGDNSPKEEAPKGSVAALKAVISARSGLGEDNVEIALNNLNSELQTITGDETKTLTDASIKNVNESLNKISTELEKQIKFAGVSDEDIKKLHKDGKNELDPQKIKLLLSDNPPDELKSLKETVSKNPELLKNLNLFSKSNEELNNINLRAKAEPEKFATDDKEFVNDLVNQFNNDKTKTFDPVKDKGVLERLQKIEQTSPALAATVSSIRQASETNKKLEEVNKIIEKANGNDQGAIDSLQGKLNELQTLNPNIQINQTIKELDTFKERKVIKASDLDILRSDSGFRDQAKTYTDNKPKFESRINEFKGAWEKSAKNDDAARALGFINKDSITGFLGRTENFLKNVPEPGASKEKIDTFEADLKSEKIQLLNRNDIAHLVYGFTPPSAKQSGEPQTSGQQTAVKTPKVESDFKVKLIPDTTIAPDPGKVSSKPGLTPPTPPKLEKVDFTPFNPPAKIETIPRNGVKVGTLEGFFDNTVVNTSPEIKIKGNLEPKSHFDTKEEALFAAQQAASSKKQGFVLIANENGGHDKLGRPKNGFDVYQLETNLDKGWDMLSRNKGLKDTRQVEGWSVSDISTRGGQVAVDTIVTADSEVFSSPQTHKNPNSGDHFNNQVIKEYAPIGLKLAELNLFGDREIKITSYEGKYSNKEKAEAKASEFAKDDKKDAVVIKIKDQFHVYTTNEILAKGDGKAPEIHDFNDHDFKDKGYEIVSFAVTNRDNSNNISLIKKTEEGSFRTLSNPPAVAPENVTSKVPLDKLLKDIGEISARVETINNEITQPSVNLKPGKLTDLGKELTGLKSALQEKKTAISSHDNGVNTPTIQNVSEQINTIDGSISKIQSAIGTFEGDTKKYENDSKEYNKQVKDFNSTSSNFDNEKTTYKNNVGSMVSKNLEILNTSLKELEKPDTILSKEGKKSLTDSLKTVVNGLAKELEVNGVKTPEVDKLLQDVTVFTGTLMEGKHTALEQSTFKDDIKAIRDKVGNKEPLNSNLKAFEEAMLSSDKLIKKTVSPTIVAPEETTPKTVQTETSQIAQKKMGEDINGVFYYDGEVAADKITKQQNEIIDRAHKLVDLAQVLNGQAPLNGKMDAAKWNKFAQDLGTPVDELKEIVNKKVGSIDNPNDARIDDVLNALASSDKFKDSKPLKSLTTSLSREELGANDKMDTEKWNKFAKELKTPPEELKEIVNKKVGKIDNFDSLRVDDILNALAASDKFKDSKPLKSLTRSLSKEESETKKSKEFIKGIVTPPKIEQTLSDILSGIPSSDEKEKVRDLLMKSGKTIEELLKDPLIKQYQNSLFASTTTLPASEVGKMKGFEFVDRVGLEKAVKPFIDTVPDPDARKKITNLFLSDKPLKEVMNGPTVQEFKQPILKYIANSLRGQANIIEGKVPKEQEEKVKDNPKLNFHPELAQLANEISGVSGIAKSLETLADTNSSKNAKNRESADTFMSDMEGVLFKVSNAIDNGATSINQVKVKDLITDLQKQYKDFLLEGYNVDPKKNVQLADKFSQLVQKARGAGFQDVEDIVGNLQKADGINPNKKIYTNSADALKQIQNAAGTLNPEHDPLKPIQSDISKLPDSEVKTALTNLSKPENLYPTKTNESPTKDDIAKDKEKIKGQFANLFAVIGKMSEDGTEAYLKLADDLLRRARLERQNSGFSANLTEFSALDTYRNAKDKGNAIAECIKQLDLQPAGAGAR